MSASGVIRPVPTNCIAASEATTETHFPLNAVENALPSRSQTLDNAACDSAGGRLLAAAIGHTIHVGFESPFSSDRERCSRCGDARFLGCGFLCLAVVMVSESRVWADDISGSVTEIVTDRRDIAKAKLPPNAGSDVNGLIALQFFGVPQVIIIKPTTRCWRVSPDRIDPMAGRKRPGKRRIDKAG